MSQDYTILDSWADALAERVADKLWARMAQAKQSAQDNNNLAVGWKAIAKVLGISERKAKNMRAELGDAIIQPFAGGSVSADKEELLNVYKRIGK